MPSTRNGEYEILSTIGNVHSWGSKDLAFNLRDSEVSFWVKRILFRTWFQIFDVKSRYTSAI